MNPCELIAYVAQRYRRREQAYAYPVSRPVHGVSAPECTPARAGTTSLERTRRSTQRDHPRSRGEHGRTYDEYVQEGGPSPLARGAPLLNRAFLKQNDVTVAGTSSGRQ